MGTGNAQQSVWSQEFHASRGDVTIECPAAEFGGHLGLCKEVHPRGITLLPGGGWKVVPESDGWHPTVIEHYA